MEITLAIGVVLGAWIMLSLIGSERDRMILDQEKAARIAAEAAQSPDNATPRTA